MRSNDAPAKSTSNIAYRAIFKEMVVNAFPFAIVSLAIPFYQLIETYAMNTQLIENGMNQLQAENENSLIALSQKLVLIPVSIATAFGITLIPAITRSVTAKRKKETNDQIKKTFNVLLWTTLPLVIAMMALAKPIFGALFGTEHMDRGGELLMAYSPSIMVYSLFIVTAAILQGMDGHRFAVGSMVIGVLSKWLLTPIAIAKWGTIGTVVTTDIGFIISIAINIWVISKSTGTPIRVYLNQERGLWFVCAAFIGICVTLSLGSSAIVDHFGVSKAVTPWLVCIITGIPFLIGYFNVFTYMKKRM
jgi:O-antigen/teichoic acid export membrane protein